MPGRRRVTRSDTGDRRTQALYGFLRGPFLQLPLELIERVYTELYRLLLRPRITESRTYHNNSPFLWNFITGQYEGRRYRQWQGTERQRRENWYEPLNFDIGSGNRMYSHRLVDDRYFPGWLNPARFRGPTP